MPNMPHDVCTYRFTCDQFNGLFISSVYASWSSFRAEKLLVPP